MDNTHQIRGGWLGLSIAHDTEAWKTFENCITNPSTKWFLLKIS